jgi:hypothetical protein
VYARGAGGPDPARDDAAVTAARRRRARTLLVTGLLAVAATACGGGGGGDGACGPIVRESLDSAYLVHVLGDDTDVEYASDPPTSGPHQPGPEVDGVVAEPITRPVQVGILERGDILLQHDPDLPAAQLADLEAIGGPGVVIAPNPDLPEPVVATAWTYKRTCSAVDVGALEDFVDQRAGKGPEG